MNRRNPSPILFAVGILGALCLPLFGCSPPPVTEEATVTVQPGTVEIQISVGGRVESSQQSSIIAPDDMTVEDLLVTNGQKVTKGAVLAKLDTAKVTEQLRAEETKLSQNQVQAKTDSIRLAGLLRDLERSKRLLKSGAISIEEKEKIAQEYEIQSNQTKTQQRERASIEEAIRRLRNQAQMLNVPAPFDGVITYQWVPKDTFIKGSSVKKGDLLFRVSSEGKMVLKATLREEDVSYFSSGQKLPLRFPSSPGVSTEARVVMVDSAATIDKETGVATFRLYLDFTPPPTIKAGMEAIAEFSPQKKENVLSVPKTALRPIGEKGFEVKVVEGNLKSIRRIEVGFIGDSSVEVTAGLSAGQKVLARYE